MERHGVTYKSVDVEFEGRVVTLFRIVKMYEEEYIRPYVMFIVDVVVETLDTNTLHYMPVRKIKI